MAVRLEYEDIRTKPGMRHYVIAKCADLIGCTQYSLSGALCNVFDVIFELSSIENLILCTFIDYLQRLSEL